MLAGFRFESSPAIEFTLVVYSFVEPVVGVVGVGHCGLHQLFG